MYDENKYDFENLIDWLKESYKYNYTDIPQEVKDLTIDIVVNSTEKIFTKKDILEHDDYCQMCGVCCVKQGCPDYNRETHECTIWNKRPNVCKFYPLGPEMLWLTLDCGFVINLLKNELNKRFDKIVVE